LRLHAAPSENARRRLAVSEGAIAAAPSWTLITAWRSSEIVERLVM